jgi:site-specific DNA-methyltransferase (adenine-specific)
MIAEPLRPLARPITEFRLLEGNPRRGDVAAVKRSLRKFGQRKPIVVREDGTVEAGNTTLKAALELGWTELAAVAFGDDDATAKAFALADNRTSELGSFDLAALAAMAVEVQAADPGLLEAAAYSEADLNALLAGLRVPEKRTDPDAVPDAPAEPVTVLGDLWELGPHRLLCGDSTKRDDVGRLLGDDRPDLMVTDPPYGVMYGGDKGKNAISGDLSQSVIPISFAVAVEYLATDARVYLFGGSGNWQMYASLFDHHLRMQVRAIVWAKESFVLRPNNYHSQFEMVYFGWKGNGGSPDHWYGDRKQSDLWQVSRREESEKVHPTQKPVEVCAIPIRNSCPPGGLIYEPFGGSGSTLIAAHATSRTVRVMELDPRFCDVICRRYQEHAGTKPVLQSTGQPHDFTA